MRRNPRLPKSSVIEDNAEKIADSIFEFVRMKAAKYPRLGKNTDLSEIIGDGERFQLGYAMEYSSSSGVSGAIALTFGIEDRRRDSFSGSARSIRDPSLPYSLIKIDASAKTKVVDFFQGESRENMLETIVHEIGHVIDKSTRYTRGSAAIKESHGHLGYVNSRVEIQAEAQAVFYALKKRIASYDEKVSARDLEGYFKEYAPYSSVMRYRKYTEPSKRIFLLYLYNALNDEGLL